MKFFNGFSTGFSSFFKAIPFIFKNKLWWVFIIPILLNIILYSVGFTFTDYVSDIANSYVNNWLGNGGSQSKFMQALPGILTWIIKILMQIIFFLAFAFFSGYIILIIMSPLFAWLSERTDQILNKTNYPFNFKQFFIDIWYGILIALRNFAYEIAVVIIVLLANLIPILNIFTGLPATIFLFIISSYFYGFAYMYYNLERRKFKVKESVQFIKKYRGMAIANGALFSLSLFIPFFGVMLSGGTAIIATVGATIAMNDVSINKDNH